MVTEKQVERVYEYIWQYLRANERLPLRQEMVAELGMTRSQVNRCIEFLHIAELLHPTTLLPMNYQTWWRENRRAGGDWTWPKIVPLQKRIG